MSDQQLRHRTKQLALRVLKMAEALPRTRSADIIGRQIIRSATSVGANYRASVRAKSTADLINKLKIVEEEADETLYWLELLVEANIFPEHKLADLISETNQIVAMVVASIKTLRAKNNRHS